MTSATSLHVLLLLDKLMAVTNLTTRVPVLLDLDEMIYSSWEYIFQQLCRGDNLLEHILGKPTEASTPSTPRARSIALKVELRSLKLGDLSIILEGSPSKYDNVYGIIVHREQFLDLKTFLKHFSQYTWHQRLGHPRSEVLRRVLSSNSISYNKDKSLVLCHACQLGKHVRLPFIISTSSVTSMFELIHSDLTVCPTQRFTLHVSSISPLPKSYSDAFTDPNWQNAMTDEYNALIKNNTWTLVPRPVNVNIVQKYLADGTLSRYKACLVANGITQINGIDVDETFSPDVKPGTIQTVLSLAISRHWPVHQLDVKNASLHGDLSETVYMHQPSGFRDSAHSDYVWTDTAYLLLYVNDIVLTASSKSLYVLSQRKYATEILEHAHMLGCNSSQTPIDTESKLGVDGDPVSNLTLYQSLAGLLQYLTFTRLDISYAVQQLLTSMRIGIVSILLTNPLLVINVFLGNNLLSWSSKRQPTLSRSSAEAEYHGIANAVAETCWLRNLQRELHTPLSSATLVYYDNVSAVYLSSNPVQHQRTKHIEIDIHFV
ncbi:ribonuclease H-like domain-containing protein [Tanacetum coccineum]|uniref:Ribonuclease H-like domain-containing protein n=1 Tax=Tanacetum coccineum TaxID=301880 RepID=A0ABQ5FN52_9ASTR